MKHKVCINYTQILQKDENKKNVQKKTLVQIYTINKQAHVKANGCPWSFVAKIGLWVCQYTHEHISGN